MGCGCGKQISSSTTPLVAGIRQTENINDNIIAQVEQAAPVVKPSGYNILDVLQDKLSGRIQYVEKDILESRLAKCHSCEHLKIGLCMQCGCIVEFKTRYTESSCPLGKW